MADGLGAVLGALLGAAGGALGQIDKKDKENKQQKLLHEDARENKDWFLRDYYSDATQRADAQRLLSRTEEYIKQRNRAAEGRAAVMGGTEQSVEDEKESNNKLLADVTSQVAARSESRKDAIRGQYMDDKRNLLNKKMELIQNGTGIHEGFDAVVGGAANGMSLGSSFG